MEAAQSDNEDDLSDLEGEFSTLEGAIETNTNALTTLEDTTIANLSSAISDNATAIAGFDVSDLQAKQIVKDFYNTNKAAISLSEAKFGTCTDSFSVSTD